MIKIVVTMRDTWKKSTQYVYTERAIRTYFTYIFWEIWSISLKTFGFIYYWHNIFNVIQKFRNLPDQSLEEVGKYILFLGNYRTRKVLSSTVYIFTLQVRLLSEFYVSIRKDIYKYKPKFGECTMDGFWNEVS